MLPDDEPIDAAPCPNCRSPLAVVAADLGHLVECPNCATQFRARRTGAEPPPRRDEPRKWDDEERPTSRNRDREYEDEDREMRPERGRPAGRRGRPRSRDGEDDLPSRSPPKQAAAVGAAVMSFVFAGIALIEGICGGVVAGAAMSEGPRGDHDAPFGSNRNAALAFIGFGVCNLVGVGLMIPAGIGLLTRRGYGRVLGFLSAGLALIFVLELVVITVAIISADRSARVGAAVVFMIPILLWLAYAITTLILLGKVRPAPR